MSTIPFISRSDLGNHLGLNLNSDAHALEAIDAACQLVRDMSEQQLDLVADDPVAIRGSDTDVLLLPELPVGSITSITDSETALPITFDYTIEGDGMLRAKYPCSWSRFSVYTVTYTHGYSPVPTSLRMVALQIAARIFQQGGVSSEVVGTTQTAWAVPDAFGISNAEERIISMHRRRR